MHDPLVGEVHLEPAVGGGDGNREPAQTAARGGDDLAGELLLSGLVRESGTGDSERQRDGKSRYRAGAVEMAIAWALRPPTSPFVMQIRADLVDAAQRSPGRLHRG
jgi:hypothetical protein